MKTPRMSRFGKTATLATLVALCVAIGLFGTQERAEGWSAGGLPGMPPGGAHGMMADDATWWLQMAGWSDFSDPEIKLIRDGASMPDALWLGGSTRVKAAENLEAMLGEDLIYCPSVGDCVCIDFRCEVLWDDYDELRSQYIDDDLTDKDRSLYWLQQAKTNLATSHPKRAAIHSGYAMHFAQDYLNPPHLPGWGQKQTLWELIDHNFILKAEAEFDLFGRCFASDSDVLTRISNDLTSYRRYNEVLWPDPPPWTWIWDQASEYVALDGRIKGAVNWSEQVSLEILQYVFGLLQPPEGCVFSPQTSVAYVYSSWGQVALADEINKMDVLEPGEYGFTTYNETNIDYLWDHLGEYEVLLIDEDSFYKPDLSDMGGPIYQAFTNHAAALRNFVKKGGGIFTTGGNDLEKIRTWNWLPPEMRVTSYGHDIPSQSGVSIVNDPGLYSYPNHITKEYLSGAHPGGSHTHTWFTSKSPGYTDTVRRNDHGPGHKRTVELVGYFGKGVIVASEVEAEAGDARYYLQNMLNFLKPSRSFGLEFLSPQSGGSFLVGQQVPLLVAARDAAGNPASGATVTLNSPTGEPIPLTERTDSPGIYQATYTISPTDPIEEWAIGVVGSVGGEFPKQATSVQISETPSFRLGWGGHGPHGVAVNPNTNRIYVTNWTSNNVSVIDGASNTVVATVAVGYGPYGVAVNPNTDRIYVANSISDTVSVIDGASNTVVDTVAVGSWPHGVAVNANTNRIYVANYGSDNVSVIDGASNTVVATVAVEPDPGEVAVNPNTNRIYVVNNESNNVSVIDGASNTVVATVAVGPDPWGVAVNPNTNLIYVTDLLSCNVSVIDGASNTVVATVAVGGSWPYGVAVNPNTDLVYVASSIHWEHSGNVSVIDGGTNTVVATVAVGPDPRGVAVNPNTNRIYVTDLLSCNVSVIDGASNTVVATVAVGINAEGVAVNPNTNRIYVANHGGNVSVIDGASNTVVATVAVGTGPARVAVNPNTNRIYVANSISDTVSVIDGASNTVVDTVAVGSWPHGVAVNPNTNRIYVTNWTSNNVSVIDGASNTVVATVAVGIQPYAAAVNPNTNRIYVAHYGGNVSVIDGASNTVVATVAVGGSWLYGVAVNPNTNRIYVTNYGSDNVSVIDGASNTVVATVAVGYGPYGVAVNPNTDRIYVTNYGSNNVSVIDGAGNTVVATVAVGSGPEGVAVNPNTNCIYVTNTDDDTVSLIGNCPNASPAADSSVTVELNGGLGSIGGMEATFSSVMAGGDTSLDVANSGPPAPPGYDVVGIAGQPAYFDMNTTADFSGPIAVCIAYDETQVTAPESELKLMHYVGEEFVDITGFVEPEGNVICGEATSLSVFAIMQSDPDSDNDMMRDAYEQAHACLNPLAADSLSNYDGDTLFNYGEMVVGTDPCLANPELALDSDGDGANDGRERYMGTDPLDACPDVLGTPGRCPGPSCDGDDCWPYDLTVNRTANIIDVLLFKPVLNKALGNPSYDRRYDFDADGSSNILDVLLYKPVLGMSCSP